MDVGNRVDKQPGGLRRVIGGPKDVLQRPTRKVFDNHAPGTEVLTGPVVPTRSCDWHVPRPVQRLQQLPLSVAIADEYALAGRRVTAQHEPVGRAVAPADVSHGAEPAVAAGYRAKGGYARG